MCLIIAQHKNTARVTVARLSNAFRANDDGAGVAYVGPDGKVCNEKPFHSLATLLEYYEWVHDTHGKDSPILLHMRIATHGNISERNTHPHWIARMHAVLAHNGVLRIDIPKGSPDSDTAAFCDRYLADIPPERLHHKKRREKLGRLIGTANKFAILVNTGDLYVINESAGHWDRGVWYSNHSYEGARMYTGRVSDDEWDAYSGWRHPVNAPAISMPNGLPKVDRVSDREVSILRLRPRPTGHHTICKCAPCELYYEAIAAYTTGRAIPRSAVLDDDEDTPDPYAGDGDETMDLGTHKPDPAAGSGYLGAGD